MPTKPAANEVFISYSHSDSLWLERLRIHLRPLVREATITCWDDSMVQPGSEWHHSIDEALNRASAAVLLISADFLASDFIMTEEVPRLLAAVAAGRLVILPLLVSPCRFQQTEALSQLQSVNSPSRPLTALNKNEQEAVLVEVAEAVATVLRGKASQRLDELSSSETESGQPVDPPQHPSYFCYISHDKVDRLFELYGSRASTKVPDPPPATAAHQLMLIHKGRSSYGRPDYILRNSNVLKEYMGKLATVAIHLASTTRDFETAPPAARDLNSFFFYAGEFRMQNLDATHGMATIASNSAAGKLELDCSLRYFSTAVSADGTLMPNSSNYGFLHNKLALTFHTAFLLLAKHRGSYRGSPLYLELRGSSTDMLSL